MLDSIRTLSYYEAKYKFTSINNGHIINTSEKFMMSRLQNELDDFVEFFLIGIFVLYIRLGEWSRHLNIKFDLKFFNEITKYYSLQKPKEESLVSLYYNMLTLLNTEDEKYYFELMKGRNRFEKKLSKMDDYNIAIVSMQYCYKRVMKGNSEYRKHQFEITKKIIKNNLIPEGYIEFCFFTNIVRNASHLKEFQWLEKFISEYKGRLKPESAKELIDYSYAMIDFGKGNYENSLKRLSKINIERSNMKLDIKNLQIMNYYELDYKLELESRIDSYKHFLQRDKTITQQLRTSMMQFLNYVSDLIKIYHSGKKKSVFLLKKEIENKPYFYLKDWLLTKVNQMEI